MRPILILLGVFIGCLVSGYTIGKTFGATSIGVGLSTVLLGVAAIIGVCLVVWRVGLMMEEELRIHGRALNYGGGAALIGLVVIAYLISEIITGIEIFAGAKPPESSAFFSHLSGFLSSSVWEGLVLIGFLVMMVIIYLIPWRLE